MQPSGEHKPHLVESVATQEAEPFGEMGPALLSRSSMLTKD